MVTPSILSYAFVDYDYLLALYLKCVCAWF
jgi:hypothetical protein